MVVKRWCFNLRIVNMRRLYYNAKMSSKSVFVAWLVVFVFSFLLFTWVKKNVLVELQVQNVTVLSPPESEAGDEDEAEPEFVNIYELNMTRVGEWVPGYRHVEDCQVKMRDPQSTCCSLKGRKLHFEFYDDNLKNNDSVLEEVLQKVKGKNVTIFGDSLQRNFFMGVAEVFKLGEKFGNVPLNDGEEYQVKWYSVLGEQEPPFNLHLLQYYTYEAEPCSPAVQHFKLSKKMLLEGLNKSEIIILNSGLHMSFCNESFFLNNTQLIIDILVEEKKQHPEKQIILRSTLPQHFDVSDESGYYDGKQEKQHCANVTTFLNHWTNYYVDEICRKYGFKYMDPAPIYMDRFDLHFEEYTSLDCTHFCYTPEIYIPEVVMLNELLE